jgi:hypothetical protein
LLEGCRLRKLLALMLLLPLPVSAQEVYTINVNKLCAAIVNIPYASDNFSDKEWEEFKKCMRFVEQFREH